MLSLFYGPVSLSHFRHFSMFTAASPIWKLPNMLPIFLLLPVPFFLSPIYILSRMLPTLYFTILSPIPTPWAYSFKFLCLRSRFARNWTISRWWPEESAILMQQPPAHKLNARGPAVHPAPPSLRGPGRPLEYTRFLLSTHPKCRTRAIRFPSSWVLIFRLCLKARSL